MTLALHKAGMSLHFTQVRAMACRGTLRSGLFYCWPLLRNNYIATNLQGSLQVTVVGSLAHVRCDC